MDGCSQRCAQIRERGFCNAEGRIAGVRRYALVGCAALSVASVPAIYTQVSIEQLKAAHGKTHPAETGKKA